LNGSNPNELAYLNDSLNVRDSDYYGDRNVGAPNQKSLNNQGLAVGSDSDDVQPNGYHKDYDGFQND